MVGGEVVEHRSSRPGRWLRTRRLRITLAVAAVEGLFVVFHVLSWWFVVLFAALALGFWWYVGRRNRSDLVRVGSWIAGASQLLVTMVPLVLVVATSLAIGVVVLLALGALILLFAKRS